MVFHRFYRVGDQIDEDFLNQYRVHKDQRKILFEKAVDRDAALTCILLNEANSFTDHLRYASALLSPRIPA